MEIPTLKNFKNKETSPKKKNKKKQKRNQAQIKRKNLN